MYTPKTAASGGTYFYVKYAPNMGVPKLRVVFMGNLHSRSQSRLKFSLFGPLTPKKIFSYTPFGNSRLFFFWPSLCVVPDVGLVLSQILGTIFSRSRHPRTGHPLEILPDFRAILYQKDRSHWSVHGCQNSREAPRRWYAMILYELVILSCRLSEVPFLSEQTMNRK